MLTRPISNMTNIRSAKTVGGLTALANKRDIEDDDTIGFPSNLRGNDFFPISTVGIFRSFDECMSGGNSGEGLIGY